MDNVASLEGRPFALKKLVDGLFVKGSTGSLITVFRIHRWSSDILGEAIMPDWI